MRVLRGRLILGEREERLARLARRRRLLWAGGGLMALAALCGLYFSPLFRVQAVEVVGAQHLSAPELQTLSGLEGKSMLGLPLDQAEQRIASLNLVQSVQAERLFPNRVRLRVQERVPWGYWQRGDARYVIDSEGVVLEGVSPARDAPTIIDTTSSEALTPGQRVPAAPMALAREISKQAPGLLGVRVVRFEYSIQEGLALETDAGYRVVVGDGQGLEYKLAVWEAVQKALGAQSLPGRVLDLRFGDRPALR